MTPMTTNTDNDIHCNDLTQLSSREQLSALMDGALPADQTRFLLRRLQHDDSLAECWERWRITGETMRGLAPAQRLPADFASRVSAALHGGDIVAEKAASARGTARMPAWLRWSGGAAVAASLAMVALVVRQPVGDPAAATPAVQVASAPAVSAPAAPQLPVPTPEPVVADASELVAAAAVVASTRPLRERASTTARTSRQATQAPQSVVAVQVAPAGGAELQQALHHALAHQPVGGQADVGARRLGAGLGGEVDQAVALAQRRLLAPGGPGEGDQQGAAEQEAPRGATRRHGVPPVP